MSKTAELRQKRGELWDKAKAFLNEHADENGMSRVIETIPELYRSVPKKMAEAYRELQVSGIEWTFFSPAVDELIRTN